MRKIVYALLAATVLGGAVYGAAASLNGINSASIGADDTLVASCDQNGVEVSYGSYYATTDQWGPSGPVLPANGFLVNSVTVGDINPACNGETIRVALTKDGDQIGVGQALVSSPSTVVFVGGISTAGPTGPFSWPYAKDVNDIHIEIG